MVTARPTPTRTPGSSGIKPCRGPWFQQATPSPGQQGASSRSGRRREEGSRCGLRWSPGSRCPARCWCARLHTPGKGTCSSAVCRAQSTSSLPPPLMAPPIPPSASFWPISSPSDPSVHTSAHQAPGPAQQACCQGAAAVRTRIHHDVCVPDTPGKPDAKEMLPPAQSSAPNGRTRCS